MKKGTLFLCVLLFATACKKHSSNTASVCLDTLYKTACLKIPPIISSNYTFYNGENRGDIEGFQDILFTHNTNDTAYLTIYQFKNIQTAKCDRADSIIFDKHTLLIQEMNKGYKDFSYSAYEKDDIKFHVTKYNQGAYISMCMTGETIRIELWGLTDTTLRNEIISSIELRD